MNYELNINQSVESTLTEIFKEIIPNRKELRIHDFIGVLTEKLKHIEKDILNSKVKSEEFIDLLEDALPQVTRVLSQERQNYIASLLKNSLTNEQFEQLESKKLLQLLNELNDSEILLLHFLSLKYSQIDQTERIEFAERHLYLFDDYNQRNSNSDSSLNSKSLIRKSYMSKLEEIGLAAKSTPEKPIFVPWFSRQTNSSSRDYNKITMITSGNLGITSLGILLLHNIDLI